MFCKKCDSQYINEKYYLKCETQSNVENSILPLQNNFLKVLMPAIVIVITLILTVFLTACSGTSSSRSTGSKSAIDSLNSDEKLIFDALLIALQDFYNPSQTRVLNVQDPFSDGSACKIQLQSTNQFGGTTSEYYHLILSNTAFSSLKKGSLVDGLNSAMISPEKVSVTNLNKALSEHWENLGVN